MGKTKKAKRKINWRKKSDEEKQLELCRRFSKFMSGLCNAVYGGDEEAFGYPDYLVFQLLASGIRQFYGDDRLEAYIKENRAMNGRPTKRSAKTKLQ